MNILFLGQYYPPRLLHTFIEDTGGKVGFSNHNFEKSLIKGFASQKDVCLKIITVPLAFSYPRSNKRAHINREEFREHNCDAVSIGYCNLIGINSFHKVWNLKREIRKLLRDFPEGEIHVVVNTPSYVLLAALFEAIKNHRSRIKTTVIVPDVPECMTGMDHHNFLAAKILNHFDRATARYSSMCDKFVYLTSQMNDFYKRPSSEFMVMEGLIDDDKVEITSPTPLSKDKEIILYAGTLRRIFGVMNLVEVFANGNFSNCELWICGAGECAAEIEQAARKNPNIKFFGLVSQDEALHLQSKATILANPRGAEGEYTKYSFPSKTIEYLLAGKTLIMNRLPGIPEEYDQFIIYPESETVEAWIDSLNNIFSMDEASRNKKAAEARQFIIDHKTAKTQCARIIDFIRNTGKSQPHE